MTSRPGSRQKRESISAISEGGKDNVRLRRRWLCAGQRTKTKLFHSHSEPLYVRSIGAGRGRLFSARARSGGGVLVLQLECCRLACSLRFGLFALTIIAQLADPLSLSSRAALGLRKVHRRRLLRAEALLCWARGACAGACGRIAARGETARAGGC